MSEIESLKGFVNAWDCDENDHLNVQFYMRFFEDACAHFQVLSGQAASRLRRPAVRHIRYHGELRKNDSVQVTTGRVGTSRLVHMLNEPASGRLSATCVETYTDPLPETLPECGETVADAAAPRSIEDAPARPDTGDESGAAALRSRLRVQHCDRDGVAYDSAFIGFNSDAAGFFWSNIGIDEPWLRERNLGRVAVEMKLTRLGDPMAGDLIHVTTRPVAIARSTVTFKNLFTRTETNEVAAIVMVTALTMNLDTRRAEPLPDDLRASVEQRIRAG